MKIATQKHLLAVFLVLFWVGLFLLLYDLILSLILIVPSGVGMSILLTENTGVTTEWSQFAYLKARGKTRKTPEKKKVSPWLMAWLVVWISFGVVGLYVMLSIVFSIGVLFFYAWIAGLFILLYHQFDENHSAQKPAQEV
jgi:hypothetical protein